MAQFERPDSDVSAGAWTTAPLWSKIDEASYDEADYIQLNNSASSTCELGLSNATDPVSSVNHTIRCRVKKTGSGTISLNVFLFQGAVQKATFTATLTTSYANQTYTLTAGEANSITDYNDLRLKFTGICGASGRYVFVAWAEMEVPTAATVWTQGVNGAFTPAGAPSFVHTWVRSLTAAITPVGIVVKSMLKKVTGEITPVGVPTKFTYKNVIGEITPVRILTKSLWRTLIGAITSVGSLATLHIPVGGTLWIVGIDGATSPTGVLVKSLYRTVIRTLTSSGLSIKSTHKNTVGAVSSTGSVRKIPYKMVSGVASFSRVTIKCIEKFTSGQVNVVGELVRLTSKTLTGAITFVGDLVSIYIGVVYGILGVSVQSRSADVTVNERKTAMVTGEGVDERSIKTTIDRVIENVVGDRAFVLMVGRKKE